MAIDDDVATLRIQLGHTGSGNLFLRFSPEFMDEIFALLDERGIEHSPIIELSAGPPEWIEAVQVLGTTAAAGMTSLAAVVGAFAHRRKGKRLKLVVNGTEVDAQGYSVKELEQLLSKLPKQQLERDAKTREVLGYDAEPDGWALPR